jgi:C-terminal processing protease CtpA/Prc
MNFDLTTPTQFCEEVDSLLASGCKKFVFDVRYNPGGDLESIRAVLSYFLN